MSTPKNVLIASIKENPAALRGCNKESEAYKGVRDSIRDHGLMNPIAVREIPNGDGTVSYTLVDGLQRLTAHIELGKNEIAANVLTLSDAAALEAQIISNAHRVETRPVEYCGALIRILATNPAMTQIDLAGKLNKSATWISQMMNLNKLDEGVAKLVNEGKINLSNAFALAKLPKDEQGRLIVDAQTTTSDQFMTKCLERSKEIKAANRSGSDKGPAKFVATPKLRKIAELQAEIGNSTVAAQLCKEADVKSVAQAFVLGLKWALNLDPSTLKVLEQQFMDKEKKSSEEKAVKAAKIAAERTASATKAAADAQAAAAGAGLDLTKLMADANAPKPVVAATAAK